jgi:hypothetical protein
MEFQRCGLVRCRFSGPLNEVLFDARVFPGDEQQPNYCIDVDMSGVVFHLTEFLGFNLPAVKLPDEPGLRPLTGVIMLRSAEKPWLCVPTRSSAKRSRPCKNAS